MYGKREGLLDIHPEYVPGYYLVLTGPKSTATSAEGAARPWAINEVLLFEAEPLIDRLRGRGVKFGAATSVRVAEWESARIYPGSPDSPLEFTKAE